MALLDSEVRRIRYELGYNVLDVGAEPYIGVTALFEQVIKPHVTAGAATTSSTAVSAATTPTPVAITLASATGFVAGGRVVVDVDARQEYATIQSLVGAVATMQLAKAHSGTYPVTVEGGESIVREILRECIRLGGGGGLISSAASKAGLKKVDEIEFFGDSSNVTITAQQRRELARWRDDLASALGVENLRASSGGGGSIGLY